MSVPMRVFERIPSTLPSPLLCASAFFPGLAGTVSTSNPAASNARAAPGWIFSRRSAFMASSLGAGGSPPLAAAGEAAFRPGGGKDREGRRDDPGGAAVDRYPQGGADEGFPDPRLLVLLRHL